MDKIEEERDVSAFFMNNPEYVFLLFFFILEIPKQSSPLVLL